MNASRMRAAPLALAVACLAAPAAHAAPASAIRTGGPSDPGDPKRAVVLSARVLAGRPFTVVDASGTVVLRGRLVAARGSAAPWRHAAIADLGRLRRPGAYRVRVGRLVARHTWVVLPRGAAASRAIRHALRFFATNADGREASPAHGPSHLHDATVRGGPLDGQHVDLTGGWMDAGDTLKFTQTTSFAVVALLASARLAPADASRLRTTADVGVRWLLAAHPAAGTFVSQVGEIHADHDRDTVAGFDPAADDASPLPALAQRQALVGIGLDSGGRTAAALALAARAEADPARRALLVGEARAWYEAGGATEALAPRLPEDPYPSGSGNDDMALGAIELFRATGEPGYVADAIDWLDGAEPSEPLTWDAVGPLVAAELCGVLGAPAPSAAARSGGCAFLRASAAAAARRARRHVLGTPGVLDFGTTATHGGAGTVLALAAASGVAADRALAADARDWVLGRNTWGRSFVAGLGPGSPRRPHHWAGRQAPSRFAGAVVGGPTTRAVLREQRLAYRPGPFDGPAGIYADAAANYVTSEPAIDYTASTILLLAAVGAQAQRR